MFLHFCHLSIAVIFSASITALARDESGLDFKNYGDSNLVKELTEYYGRSLDTQRRKRAVTTQTVNYKECDAPNGRRGHCRHLEDCLIDEFTKNYTQNIKHFCVISERNSQYAGVCCPDNVTPEVMSPKIGASLASIMRESPVCGLNGKKQDRIVSGSSADYNDWPWMVALMRKKTYKKSLSHFCGAVLISNRLVLSAAHCFDAIKWEETTVRIGAYDFEKSEAFPFSDYRVTAAKIHPEYDRATNENDIVLLQLNRPVKYGKTIRPICMPPLKHDLVNKTAIVVGWGSTSFGGPPSKVLLQVNIPVWELERCRKQYTQPLADSCLCASAYEGGKDACQGDSGGPLFFQREDGKWMTIGVVSWGIGCAQKGKPGIYTRVSNYLPWISKHHAELQ